MSYPTRAEGLVNVYMQNSVYVCIFCFSQTPIVNSNVLMAQPFTLTEIQIIKVWIAMKNRLQVSSKTTACEMKKREKKRLLSTKVTTGGDF